MAGMESGVCCWRSVAEALVRRTTVPVLTVRREFAIDEIASSL
jgi:hypothetical protein